MLRMIIMTISLIAVVLVNVAANIIPFNGSTTVEIATDYRAHYASEICFSLWAVHLRVTCLSGYTTSKETTYS